MTEYHVIIPGTPFAKGRPKFSTRGGFARAYTPKKTVAFEQLVALFTAQAGVKPIEGPVRVTIVAYWPMKGQPRKKIPRPIEPKISRPDCDNVAKAVLDGMEGVAFANDSQVVSLTVTKWHACQGEEARTEVFIETFQQWQVTH